MRRVSLESLRILREQTALLHVTRCRMFHERVRVADGVVLRVRRGEPEPGCGADRLCTPEVRARNLACGHTMARCVLLDAVEALHAAGMPPDAARGTLQQALTAVSDAIHLLDHQKGDAERLLALSSAGKRQPCVRTAEDDLASAAAEVERLEVRHDTYAEQIRELRSAVLARLDAALSGNRFSCAPSEVSALQAAPGTILPQG